MKTYAVYQGDVFKGIDTKLELASQLGVKIETVEFLMTPSHRKRVKSYESRYIFIDLGKDWDDSGYNNALESF